MASAGFIRALIIARHFSHFAIDLIYSIKKSTIRTSPIIVITNNKSKLPVAGPNAAKANIRNPERNSVGVFCLIHTAIPTIIKGITVPNERKLLMVSAHAGLESAELWRTTSPI